MTANPRIRVPAAAVSNQKEPSVTVILTNYNHARYLDTSLGGIVGQTRRADEIIVIDDGSTDNSLQIIRGYAARNNNIRVLENRVNRGVQYSISRALGAATSDWVVWAAADDKLLPNFLERGIDAIVSNPDVGVVFSRLATFMDASGEERHYMGDGFGQGAFWIGPEPTKFSPDGLMDRLSNGYLWLSGNTAIVRKEHLFEVGAFVPALEWHSDWFAFYAVALRYGAVGIPETLAMMRVVENTYSASGMSDQHRQAKVMAAILCLLRRPAFSDLRAKFRARPCLFSPFAQPMLKTLIHRPRDWDILMRMIAWAIAHKNTQYRNRSINADFPRAMRTRLMRYATGASLRAINWLTPRRWRSYSVDVSLR
jgi:hypothetical protein